MMLREKLDAHRSFYAYFAVALAGLVVDYGTLILFKEVLHVFYLIAAIAGFIAGLAVNYALSNTFVFKNPKLTSKALNFGIFLIIGAVGLGLLNLFMFGMVSLLGTNYLIAKTIATIIVYFWNYFARKSLYHG